MVALAGCGSSGEPATQGDLTAAEAWLEDVCDRARDWRGELGEANGELQAGLREADTPDKVQAELLAFLERSESETAQVVRHIERSDPPRLENGEAAKRELEDGFETAQRIFTDAIGDVDALQTSDPATFQDDVREIVGTADRRLNAWPSPFDTMLEKHGGVELREAYDGAPACQTFARGG